MAYNAQYIFPAPYDKDFVMMDDPVVFDKCFGQVRDILSMVISFLDKELQRLSWGLGVIGRSFYVTGAEMCRVIDSEKSRKTLIETIWKGPRCFFEVYNEIVKPRHRLGIRRIPK